MKFKFGDIIELMNSWTSFDGKIYYQGEKFNIQSYDLIMNIYQLIGNNVVGRPRASTYDLDNYFILANATNSAPQVQPQKFQVGDKVRKATYMSQPWLYATVIGYDSVNDTYTLKYTDDGSELSGFEDTEFELDPQFNSAPAHLPFSQAVFTTIGSYGAFNPGTYKISSNIWSKDAAQVMFDPVPKKLCDCGAHKVYGENCGPESHGTWCSSLGGNK